MNRILTSSVVDPSKQQPFLAPSLSWMQDSTIEQISGVCSAIVGDANAGSPMLMSGGAFNGSGNTMFYGFIFYNGELYYFPGFVGLNSVVFGAVFVLAKTYTSGIDPITFSDGTTGNVHEIRRLAIVDQVSGSGLFDLSALKIWNQGNSTVISTGTFAGAGAAQQNITSATFTTPKWLSHKYKITFNCNVSVVLATASSEGATIAIRNSTAAADLITNSSAINAVAGMNLASYQSSLTVIYKGTIAAGQTIVAAVTRQGGNNVTIQNGYFIVEEVRE